MRRSDPSQPSVSLFTRLQSYLLAGALVLAATSDLTAATDNPPAAPQSRRWLRWLGPLAPRGEAKSQEAAQAQPQVPSPIDLNQVWTVENALGRALQANMDVQIALANAERQQGLRMQAASALFPRISLVGSLDQRAPGLIDRTAEEIARAGNPLTPITPISERGYSAQMEARQVIFDGLGSWNQLKRMSLLGKKAAVDARETYLRVASQVRQAYDVTLVRKSIVDVRRESIASLTHLAEVAERRFRAGEVAELDSLRARGTLSSAQADLATAEADLIRAQELLCRILSMDRPAQGLRLAGTLTPVEYREAFEVALRRAQASRLDVRSAQLQVEAATAAQRASQAAYLPRIEAYVNYGYRSSYYDFNRQIEGWTVGVVGRWDIFDWGGTAGAVRAQRAERRAAELHLADSQKQVGSQIRELFAALDQMKSVMAAQANARDLGERSLAEARRAYEAGRASLEQVLNAEIAYRQSFVGWLSAVYNYNAAIYQLDYATAEERFLDGAIPSAR